MESQSRPLQQLEVTMLCERYANAHVAALSLTPKQVFVQVSLQGIKLDPVFPQQRCQLGA